MQATVVDYDAASGCLEVITKTQKRLAVHLYTEDVEGHDPEYGPLQVLRTAAETTYGENMRWEDGSTAFVAAPFVTKGLLSSHPALQQEEK